MKLNGAEISLMSKEEKLRFIQYSEIPQWVLDERKNAEIRDCNINITEKNQKGTSKSKKFFNQIISLVKSKDFIICIIVIIISVVLHHYGLI